MYLIFLIPDVNRIAVVENINQQEVIKISTALKSMLSIEGNSSIVVLPHSFKPKTQSSEQIYFILITRLFLKCNHLFKKNYFSAQVIAEKYEQNVLQMEPYILRKLTQLRQAEFWRQLDNTFYFTKMNYKSHYVSFIKCSFYNKYFLCNCCRNSSDLNCIN